MTEQDLQRTASEEIIGLAERNTASSGTRGRAWTRDDAYEDRLNRYAR